MSQSRLTVNVQCTYTKDWGNTLTFLKALNPVAVTACIDSMNDRNRVYEIQQALPQATVIGRYVFPFDGGMHMLPQTASDPYIVTPTNALNAWGELGIDGRMLYLLNEPQVNGANDETVARLVKWCIEAITLATERGISLCIGNFGVGHPALNGNGEYDPRLDELLKLLSKYRDKHALGIHVYQPSDKFTRIDGLIKRCKTLGIVPVRVHMTEAGFDTTGGGDALNGYKSRGYSGEQFAAFQIDLIRNVYASYFEADVLQSVATFCWGNEASWGAFDVQNDTGWQSVIQEAKDKGLLTIAAKPQAVTPTEPDYSAYPFTAGSKYTLQSANGAKTVLRASWSVSSAAVGNSLEDKSVLVIRDVKQVAIDYWYQVDVVADGRTGWISGRGGDVTFTPVVEPPVVIPDTPPPSVPYPEVSAVYAAQMAAVYKSLSDSYALMAADSLKTSEQWASLANVVSGKAA